MTERMQYGKWGVERLLGKGGQAKVFLVHEIPTKEDGSWVDEPTLIRNFAAAIRDLVGNTEKEYILDAATRSLRLTKLVNIRRRQAALKVIHAVDDSKAVARLSRELQSMRRVEHPSLTRVLDANDNEGWFVMDYFPDGSLATNLGRTAGTAYQSLLAIRPIIDAVATLHREGLVHRDITPANIFVQGETLVLGDFGLAIEAHASGDRITSTYENVGTRDFMPPWAMGMRLEDVKPTFDVFSLGKVLWSMVSGTPRLRLWYHDKPEFDPAALFPDEPTMYWIKRLLVRTVVENPEDCFADAGELLVEVDRTLQALRFGAQRIGGNIQRVCLVCGLGEYKLKWHEAKKNVVGPRSGNELMERSKLFVCTNCGHVQLFFMGDEPETPAAWH